MKTNLLRLALPCWALFSWTAWAADFSVADALFQKRGQGYGTNSLVATQNTQMAINAYEAMIPRLRGKELIYAQARIGQLNHFLGDILTPTSNKAKRKEIFGHCEREIERINPRIVGENAPYYYFKGLCAGFYAEAGNLIDKVARTGRFMRSSPQDVLYRAIDRGFYRYLSGGIYRVGAGVFSNPLAALVGLFKPQEAIAFTSKALALTGSEDGLTGADYCDNYRFLGLAYLALRSPDRAKASATFRSAVNYFAASRDGETVSAGYLPAGQEPETLACLSRIYAIMDANRL